MKNKRSVLLHSLIRRYGNLILMVGWAVVVSGCVNLKAVNEFSKLSVENLQTFESIKFSYSDSHRENLRNQSFGQYDFATKPALPLQFDRQFTEGDTTVLYHRVDSTVLVLYQVTKEYFIGLHNLSNGDLVSFDPSYDRLSMVLQDSTTLGLSEAQTGAYRKLVNWVARTALERYRRKKTANFIEQANPDLQILLKTLDNISFKMEKAIENDQFKAYGYYLNLVTRAVRKTDALPDASYLERRRLAEQYIDHKQKLDLRREQLKNYRKTLQVISKGHQHLYENRNRIKAKELAVEMFKYGTEIRKLKTEFDKIAD